MKKFFTVYFLLILLGGSVFAQNLNSATDSVVVTNTNTVTDWGRGFEFAPTQDIWVIKFGKRVPANGTYTWVIWDVTTQTQVIQQSSLVNNPGSYVYEDIDSVVKLSSGHQYILELYGTGSAQYYYGISSQVGQHLTYYTMQYCNSCSSTTFPTSTLGGYQYGTPDFLYSLEPPVRKNDAGVTDFPDMNNGAICAGNKEVKVKITNFGSNAIDSVQVGWSVNSVVQDSQWFYFNPPLDSVIGNVQADTMVSLGTYSFIGGQYYNLKAWTSTPNGAVDSINNNDTDQVNNLYVHVLPTVNATSNSPQCANNTIQLNVNSGGNTFSWNGPNGFSSPLQNPNVANAQVNASGYYKVTVTDNNNCSNSDSVAVTVFSNPVTVNIGDDTAICSNQQLILNAGNTGSQFNWNTGAISQSVTTTDSGTYSVIVTDGNGCHNGDTLHLAFMPTPHVEGFNFIPQFYDNLGEVKFSLLNPIAVQGCIWDFGDGSAPSTSFSPTHVFPVNGGSFLITLIVNNNCGSDTVSLPIEINTETGVVKIADNTVQLSLYPNPAKDFLKLQMNGNTAIQDALIYDFSGRLIRLIHNEKVGATGMTVKTEGLSTGMYLMRLKTSAGWISRKFELVR